jgi:hypothetical protein
LCLPVHYLSVHLCLSIHYLSLIIFIVPGHIKLYVVWIAIYYGFDVGTTMTSNTLWCICCYLGIRSFLI